MFEVYGLKDWNPYAIACKSCTDHVLSVVHGAYSSPVTEERINANGYCELAYEGLCDCRDS